MINLNSPLKPDLKKLQIYLEGINKRGWYTNFGHLHQELTSRLEEYFKVKNLLLVSNGTTALQVAGRALGVESILTTPFSFAATVSAFAIQKDKISFADIDPRSFNLSVKNVDETMSRGGSNDAIVATHVYGNPCDVDGFDVIANKYDSKVIYDAAHAFGVNIGDKSVLSYGDASTLSFHATKVFHTIEGGCVVFKKSDDYEKALSIINFGINPKTGDVSPVGMNGKLNEYQAAVGLVNLDIIDDVIEQRVVVFEEYIKQLKNITEIPEWHHNANYNAAYMPIKLRNKAELKKVMKQLSEDDIQCRNYFSPSLETLYGQPGDYFPVSNDVSDTILCLPMHANMNSSEAYQVVSSIKKVL